MRGLATMLALAALVLLPAAPGFAQQAHSDDLRKELQGLKEGREGMQANLNLDFKKELDALKEGQARLQKDLQEIKTLLQAVPPAGRSSSASTARRLRARRARR